MRFSTLAGESRTLPRAVWALRILPSAPLSGSFPGLRLSLHKHVLIQTPLEARDPCKSLELSVQLSAPQSSALHTLINLASSSVSQPTSSSQGHPQLHLGSPACTAAWKRSPGNTLGKSQGSPHSLPLSWGSPSLLPDSNPWKLLFSISSRVFSCPRITWRREHFCDVVFTCGPPRSKLQGTVGFVCVNVPTCCNLMITSEWTPVPFSVFCGHMWSGQNVELCEVMCTSPAEAKPGDTNFLLQLSYYKQMSFLCSF